MGNLPSSPANTMLATKQEEDNFCFIWYEQLLLETKEPTLKVIINQINRMRYALFYHRATSASPVFSLVAFSFVIALGLFADRWEERHHPVSVLQAALLSRG